MLCLPLFPDEDPPPPMVIHLFFLVFLATSGSRLEDTIVSVSVRLPRSASLLLAPAPPEGLVLQHSEAVSPASSLSELREMSSSLAPCSSFRGLHSPRRPPLVATKVAPLLKRLEEIERQPWERRG